MVLELLTDPDSFFERRENEPGLLAPAVIVLLLGVISALGGIASVRATFQAVLPSDMQAIAGVAYVFVGIFGLLGALVVWTVYAGLFHVISAVLYDGEGEFTTTFALTGWGFLPGIVSAVVSAVATFLVFQSVTFPSDPQQMAAFARQLQSRPELLAASLLSLVFLLWQAFLWVFAVKHARRLGLREAAITVAIPVALAVVWRLYQLV